MKVGVIGAGTMGSGIAQAFAQTEGYEVCLCDINEEFAANGKAKIAKGLEKRVARGKMEQATVDAILAKITTGVKDICTDCDLIVEAAIENMEIKKQTFKELQDICKADAIFATNTSSLSITEIGAGLDRPMIGMHFFNPAPVMKLIEVIPGLETPDELTEKVLEKMEEYREEPFFLYFPMLRERFIVIVLLQLLYFIIKFSFYKNACRNLLLTCDNVSLRFT